MRLEQITGISGLTIYTASGAKRAIGNARHQVGDWVWTDGPCVFGHEKQKSSPARYVPETTNVFIQVFYGGEGYVYAITDAKTGEILARYPLPADWGNGAFIYGQDIYSFLNVQPGEIYVTTYKNGVKTEYTIVLPNSLTPNAYDAYYDENGDLNWAVMLVQGSALCKLIKGKNADIISTVNFLDVINTAKQTYLSYVQGDIQQRFTEVNVVKGSTTGPDEGYGHWAIEYVGISTYNDAKSEEIVAYLPIGIYSLPQLDDIDFYIKDYSLWDETITVELSCSCSLHSYLITRWIFFASGGGGIYNTFLVANYFISMCEYCRDVVLTRTQQTDLYERKNALYLLSNNPPNDWVQAGWTAEDPWVVVTLNSRVDNGNPTWEKRFSLGNSGYRLITDCNLTPIKLVKDDWEMDLAGIVTSINLFRLPLVAARSDSIVLYDTYFSALYMLRTSDETHKLLSNEYLYNLQIPVIKLKKKQFGKLFGGY